MHQLGRGEAVVELDEVEVLRADTRLLVCLLCGNAGEGVHVGEHLAGLLVRVAGEHGGGHLDGAALLLLRQCLQLLAADDDRSGCPVTIGGAHGACVRVGDHDVVHDLLQRHALRVGGERVEGGVRVVLLRDLREHLERGATVLVAVLHAHLGEGAGHVVGADASVGAGDRTVATTRCPLLRCAGGTRTQQADARELLDADSEAHVGLPGLDRHDGGAQCGGTRGTRVRDVVHRDAGLADLLLDLLADAALAHEATRCEDSHVRHGDSAVLEGSHCGFRSEVDGVLV